MDVISISENVILIYGLRCGTGKIDISMLVSSAMATELIPYCGLDDYCITHLTNLCLAGRRRSMRGTLCYLYVDFLRELVGTGFCGEMKKAGIV